MTQSLDLTSYRLLGRSGLRISPLALGTMTFGADWGWGAEKDEARRIFDAYIDRGGNFVDTANAYTNGSSERLVGEFAGSKRERLVISTKYTMATRQGDPNSGGNHRKSMVASVEESLRRLKSDYIDLLYVHQWDDLTPVEEILRGLDDLLRQGKVLYLGLSDMPAWQASRMQTIADLRGWTPFVALQSEYSLVERTSERDLIPMAKEMGMGFVPWSPLANCRANIVEWILGPRSRVFKVRARPLPARTDRCLSVVSPSPKLSVRLRTRRTSPLRRSPWPG
jgi:aryl-alcohol dehydrogenase-like predicted oxidoreductase